MVRNYFSILMLSLMLLSLLSWMAMLLWPNRWELYFHYAVVLFYVVYYYGFL